MAICLAKLCSNTLSQSAFLAVILKMPILQALAAQVNTLLSSLVWQASPRHDS
jgi:hypothetical protein